MIDHENHERLVSGCPECDSQLDIEMQAYRPATRGYSSDERRELEADRELMRDEFHR